MAIRTREEMVQEAVDRMRIFKMAPLIISEYSFFRLHKPETLHGIYKSETQSGILYWLSDEEKTMVRDFEDQTGKLVYHLIKSYTTFGTLYNILYVNSDDDEWSADREDILNGYQPVYTKNMDADDCGEYGGICIEMRNGGLVRTA